MKRRWLILVCAGAVCFAATAPLPNLPALGPRYKQTRERIDAMLKHRTGEPVVTEELVDLFRLPPAPDATTEATPVKKDEPVESDEEILQQTVGSLKRNTMKRDDVLYLLINQKPYKEGDVVPLRHKDKPVLLMIKRVTPSSVVFGYNAAEFTVPF